MLSVVYGGSGALGSSIVKKFISSGWKVISIDIKANSEATENVLVKPNQNLEHQGAEVAQQMHNLGVQANSVDSILCVAGGWAGGNASDKGFLSSTEACINQSIYSSVISANIASKYLKKNGFLLFTGAQASLNATPGMIGYGLAKAAVHHLVKSLANDGSGLPENSNVLAILPVTLDTPMNRSAMPGADFSSWTPLEELSNKILDWSSGKLEFESGSLVQVITKDSKTSFL